MKASESQRGRCREFVEMLEDSLAMVTNVPARDHHDNATGPILARVTCLHAAGLIA